MIDFTAKNKGAINNDDSFLRVQKGNNDECPLII